jgi:tryptophan 2-C-methyltransferase
VINTVSTRRSSNISLVNLNLIRVPAIAPYALDVLASSLAAAGHDCEILDLCRADDPIEAIRSYFGVRNPDLVGLSMRNACDLYLPSLFHLEHKGSFLESHKRLVDVIKEYVSVDRILVGGVGFSLNPAAFLSRLGLRYGVRGAGESILSAAAGSLRNRSLQDLAGGAHTFVFDGRRARRHQRVSREYVDNRWYYDVGGQAAIRTTSGCVMKCSYCAEPLAVGQSYSRSVIEDALVELDDLVNMNIMDIQTADSEFNMPFAHSKELLRAIADRRYGKDVRLWLYCQPRPFDKEYASLLARAGVVGVNFGTDHTDPDVLSALGKWYDKDDIEQATKLCKDEGIEVMHELLFGNPGDMPDKMLRAIEDIRGLRPRVIGITIGLGVIPDTPLGTMLQGRINSGSIGPGFYLAGEPMVDPTFYVDPTFRLPEIFETLRREIGTHSANIMFPALESTASPNNQLVNSERVRHQLLVEKRKGPPWFHFADNV